MYTLQIRCTVQSVTIHWSVCPHTVVTRAFVWTVNDMKVIQPVMESVQEVNIDSPPPLLLYSSPPPPRPPHPLLPIPYSTSSFLCFRLCFFFSSSSSFSSFLFSISFHFFLMFSNFFSVSCSSSFSAASYFTHSFSMLYLNQFPQSREK